MILNVNQLTKNYKNVRAIENISFNIDEGDVFAFLGPNGAGKTTTLRILLDIIKQDQGTISWNINGSRSSLPNPAVMGYLPEERGLYPDLPVLRTLVYLASIRGMHPAEAKKSALNWLEKLQLADRANEKLQALSKGNQQKVQFIASILHKPTFAILDEPFSGLDPINQEQFIGYIQELNKQGSTILLSAHQMPLVEKIANKIFLINQGKEVYNGYLKDIYQKYAGQQTFDISFSDKPNHETLNNLKGMESVEFKESNNIRITFSQGISVNKIMASLSELEYISQVKSHSADLHDIFLTLLSKKNLELPSPNDLK